MARLARFREISIVGLFGRRVLLSGFFVFAAYNGTGHSYYHWVVEGSGSPTPIQAVAGIALLTGLIALTRIAIAPLRLRGVIAVIALFFASILLRVGLGLDRFEDLEPTVFTIQMMICLFLALGMSWAHAQIRFSGERDVLHSPP